jgi:hypothetical protein
MDTDSHGKDAIMTAENVAFYNSQLELEDLCGIYRRLAGKFDSQLATTAVQNSLNLETSPLY